MVLNVECQQRVEWATNQACELKAQKYSPVEATKIISVHMKDFSDTKSPSLKQGISLFIEDYYTDVTVEPTFLNPGGTKGVSGSPVYLVREEESKKLVAIAKVFTLKNAPEFAQELRAIKTLQQLGLSLSHHVTVYNVGKCDWLNSATKLNEKALLILESAADGEGVDDCFEIKPNDQLEKIMLAAGKAFRELHDNTTSKSNADVEGYIKAINDLIPKVAALSLEGVDLAKWQATIDAVIKANRSKPGKGAIIHGDSHPGNIFAEINGDECKITLIDTPTLDLSANIDLKTGNFPPARDYSNFRVRSFDTSTLLRKPIDEYETFMTSFHRGYFNDQKQDIPLHQECLQVLRSSLGTLHRYGVEVVETQSSKNSSYGIHLELIKRTYDYIVKYMKDYKISNGGEL